MARRTEIILGLAIAFLPTSASSLHAGGGSDYWNCPYATDGACPPSRQTYGYFAPKWKRWPGVTNKDYETKIKPGELSPPTGPMETGPRVTPDELLLPPDEYPDSDTAPTPPSRGGDGPPPLTPQSERPEANILTPPAEDALEELLPNVDEPKRPADTEAVPEPSFESEEPSTPTTKPKQTPELNKPLEEDPFKDDPLFNDEAPAPPDDLKGGRYEAPRHIESLPVPAMRSVPNRLPAAQNSRSPKSRLTQSAAPVQSRDSRAVPSQAGASPLRGRLTEVSRSANPLRGIPSEDQIVADEEVLPTAAWETVPPVEKELETGWKSNPLRNQ